MHLTERPERSPDHLLTESQPALQHLPAYLPVQPVIFLLHNSLAQNLALFRGEFTLLQQDGPLVQILCKLLESHPILAFKASQFPLESTYPLQDILS